MEYVTLNLIYGQKNASSCAEQSCALNTTVQARGPVFINMEHFSFCGLESRSDMTENVAPRPQIFNHTQRARMQEYTITLHTLTTLKAHVKKKKSDAQTGSPLVGPSVRRWLTLCAVFYQHCPPPINSTVQRSHATTCDAPFKIT